MSTISDFDRLARAWLEDGPTQLSDRTLDAALEEVHLTRQRRALRVPWRFPSMPALTRATGIAAVALVAVIGAGGIVYLNSNGSGDVGSPKTPLPSVAPTTEPTVAPTPRPSEVAKGIYGWKTYTSAVYGYTISYPDDWSQVDRATEKWQPGASEDDRFQDVFFNNATAAVPDDSMIFAALQVPAPAGADLESWDGLLAAMTEACDVDTLPNSECSNEDVVTPMCLGSPGCRPVAFVQTRDGFPRALFGDPETSALTYIIVHRVDDFPGAARYGGTVTLLKSILGQMGVREPLPGETPN